MRSALSFETALVTLAAIDSLPKRPHCSSPPPPPPTYRDGRNDPCPCGSGMKFKRCHGR
jgi:uncharacterized protein YecA (UPF0149 family)